jgi:thioredoxin 1
MGKAYEVTQPERSAIDALPGVVALEFGTGWCGFCRAAEPLIASALSAYPVVRHIKVEDGPGRPLGRSFRVKLWPTVVILKDGKELARVVRPADAAEVRDALAQAAQQS